MPSTFRLITISVRCTQLNKQTSIDLWQPKAGLNNHSHWHTHSCQLSATELFLPLQVMFGTVCHSTSHLHRHYSSSTGTWRHVSLGADFPDCTHNSYCCASEVTCHCLTHESFLLTALINNNCHVWSEGLIMEERFIIHKCVFVGEYGRSTCRNISTCSWSTTLITGRSTACFAWYVAFWQF